MKVLGIDPSSRRTGYAVLDDPSTIVEAGYLRPDRTKDAALERIKAIAESLDGLIQGAMPDLVVIEVGGPGVSDKRRGGYGLVTLGVAMGVMWWVAECLAGHVVAVDERTWTAGQTKAKRQEMIATMFPAYRREIATDPGGDISDAIGLALWWYRQERRRALVG